MNEVPLRILIVDDETPARSRLKDLLADCARTVPLEVVGEAANGREALVAVAGRTVDVVLLDVRMPGMDGIEVAQHLQGLESPPAVVFTTAYDAYAIKAFEVNAIDYLLKPIRAARLLAALRKASAAAPSREALAAAATQPRRHLSVHERGRIHLVPVADILYLRAEQKYVTVRTPDREHLVEESLTRLEEEFGEAFVRVHRNCLVARDFIRGFERRVNDDGDAHWEVVLNDVAETVPVSRRQQYVVRESGRVSID